MAHELRIPAKYVNLLLDTVYRKSSRDILSIDRTNRINDRCDRIKNSLLTALEVDEDFIELLTRYCELEHRLEKLQEREYMSEAFVYSPKNGRWKKSNRWILATTRASRITEVENRLRDIIIDSTTDLDIVDSLACSFCDLEERLEKIQDRNFYGNPKIIRKRKKKQTTKDLLRFPPQQQ